MRGTLTRPQPVTAEVRGLVVNGVMKGDTNVVLSWNGRVGRDAIALTPQQARRMAESLRIAADVVDLEGGL